MDFFSPVLWLTVLLGPRRIRRMRRRLYIGAGILFLIALAKLPVYYYFNPGLLSQLWALVPEPPSMRSPYEMPLFPPRPEEDYSMRSLWRDYSYLTTATENYESWFADVDTATTVIDDMWAGTPPPAQQDDYLAYSSMRSEIEGRKEQLQLARAEYERFREAREGVIVDIVASSCGVFKLDRGNVFRRVITSARIIRDLLLVADFDDGERELEFRKTMFQAQRVIDTLKRTHAAIYHDDILGNVRAHVQAAVDYENRFIDKLRAGSVLGGDWSLPQAISLRELNGRVEKLDGIRVNMENMLIWLGRRYVIPPFRTPGDETIYLVIPGEKAVYQSKEAEKNAAIERERNMQGAKKLLGEYDASIEDIQEGVLYLLRGRDLGAQDPLPTTKPESTWTAWKKRNCGGTSCYSSTGIIGSIQRLLSFSRRPVAQVAKDEKDWIQSTAGKAASARISKAYYEKACCEDGMFAYRLRYGAKQQRRWS